MLRRPHLLQILGASMLIQQTLASSVLDDYWTISPVIAASGISLIAGREGIEFFRYVTGGGNK